MKTIILISTLLTTPVYATSWHCITSGLLEGHKEATMKNHPKYALGIAGIESTEKIMAQHGINEFEIKPIGAIEHCKVVMESAKILGKRYTEPLDNPLKTMGAKWRYINNSVGWHEPMGTLEYKLKTCPL